MQNSNDYISLAIAIFIYIGFLIYAKNKNLAIFKNNGFSMKWHYFIMFYYLPQRAINCALYCDEYSNTFSTNPFNFVIVIYTAIFLTCIASFIGFCKFKKFSYYTIISALLIEILALPLTYLVLGLSVGFESINADDLAKIIGTTVGISAMNIPTMIYYNKRKMLFKNETKKLPEINVFYDHVETNKGNAVEDPVNAEPNISKDFKSNINNLNVDDNLITKIEYKPIDEKKMEQNISHTIEENKKIIDEQSKIETDREKILFCRKCGNKLGRDALYCNKCGEKI